MNQNNPNNPNNQNTTLPIPSATAPVSTGKEYQNVDGVQTRQYLASVYENDSDTLRGFNMETQHKGETQCVPCETADGEHTIMKLKRPSEIDYRNAAWNNAQEGVAKGTLDYAQARTAPTVNLVAENTLNPTLRSHIGTNTTYTPLDQFNIKNILGLDILGNINISLTNMGLFVILSTILIVYLYVINNNYNKIIPNNMSASNESIYATVHGIVVGQINSKKGQEYFPLIFVLFIFILTNNLIGMVPYAFATTSHFILTFSLSFTIVLGATYLGFFKHKSKFFSLFVPSGCPLALLYLLVLIEFISYLSRPVSLGLRLAANVLSGHMLLNILGGFTYNIMRSGAVQFVLGLLPLAFVIAFSGLEVGVAFIQAQVFVVLSCSYIKDGLDLH